MKNTGYSFLGIFICLFGLKSFAQIYCANGSCTNVPGYGSVSNFNGTAIMAPNGSLAEWNSLVAHPPSGVSTSGCYCGAGTGCTVDAYANVMGCDDFCHCCLSGQTLLAYGNVINCAANGMGTCASTCRDNYYCRYQGTQTCGGTCDCSSSSCP